MVQGLLAEHPSGALRRWDIPGRGRIERAAAVAAASLLVAAIPITDTLGFVLAAALVLYHAATTRAQRAVAS